VKPCASYGIMHHKCACAFKIGDVVKLNRGGYEWVEV